MYFIVVRNIGVKNKLCGKQHYLSLMIEDVEKEILNTNLGIDSKFMFQDKFLFSITFIIYLGFVFLYFIKNL